MLLVPLNRGERKAQFTLSPGYSWNLHINLSIFHLAPVHYSEWLSRNRRDALHRPTTCPSPQTAQVCDTFSPACLRSSALPTEQLSTTSIYRGQEMTKCPGYTISFRSVERVRVSGGLCVTPVYSVPTTQFCAHWPSNSHSIPSTYTCSK